MSGPHAEFVAASDDFEALTRALGESAGLAEASLSEQIRSLRYVDDDAALDVTVDVYPNSQMWLSVLQTGPIGFVYDSSTSPTVSTSFTLEYSHRPSGGRIDSYGGFTRRCALGDVVNPASSLIRRLNAGTTPARMDITFGCRRTVVGVPVTINNRQSLSIYETAWTTTCRDRKTIRTIEECFW